MIPTLRSSLFGIGLALAVLASIGDASGQSFKTLYKFKGVNEGDGVNPVSNLIADEGGNLYGTTRLGGNGTACLDRRRIIGCGTVFRLAPDRTETVLHSFLGGNDGAFPNAGVVKDSAGNLYGAASSGGGNGNAGVIFKVLPDGTETILHAFVGGDNDGATPLADLNVDKKGNLYGTTLAGGPCNCGVIFKLKPDGSLIVLHAFAGGDDGKYPSAGLIRDEAGNFYGTTSQGGNESCNGYGCGTVFKLAPDGTETVLYAFQGGADGDLLYAGVATDSLGNLYGTTAQGGGTGCGGFGCGTVFRVATDGTKTVLHYFADGSDGWFPNGSVILDQLGNLYGTTVGGGDAICHCGIVFELAPDGTETVLHAFAGGSQGGGPYAGLLPDKKWNFFGTTSYGGKCRQRAHIHTNCGIIFELKH